MLLFSLYGLRFVNDFCYDVCKTLFSGAYWPTVFVSTVGEL